MALPTRHDIATGRDPMRVRIFDTTLRDGAQSPGVQLTGEEKLMIAKQLANLRVDVVEAGFPGICEDEFDVVRNIARVVGNVADPPIICGLARALEGDTRRCWDALRDASFPRIHLYVPTSEAHMLRLGKSREEVLDVAGTMVELARSLCDDVEFSAEDAVRSDNDFLASVYSRAIEAGASTINVTDSVGFTTPPELSNLIQYLRKNVRGIEDVVISVHGHNDLGLAVANFLAAVENGARQVEVTINGIGERAGNASLEEIVMALHVRREYYKSRMGRTDLSDAAPLTNIFHSELYNSSRLVSALTGISVQPNKAIVGANAFPEETRANVHQSGALKHRQISEVIMDARAIGRSKKHVPLKRDSSPQELRIHLLRMGFDLEKGELQQVFHRFQELADKKSTVFEADIEALVDSVQSNKGESPIQLRRVEVQCGDGCIPTATVILFLSEEGREKTCCVIGNGPVDAAFNAINMGTDGIVDVSLSEYQVSCATRGVDALGEVTVRVLDRATGRIYTGKASNIDIVVASAHAYVNAINRCQLNSSRQSFDGPAL